VLLVIVNTSVVESVRRAAHGTEIGLWRKNDAADGWVERDSRERVGRFTGRGKRLARFSWLCETPASSLDRRIPVHPCRRTGAWMIETERTVRRRQRRRPRSLCADGTDGPRHGRRGRPERQSEAGRPGPAATPSVVGDEAQAPRAPRRRPISVVDDDESIREALESLLRSAGFEVDVFSSAEQLLNSGRLSEVGCLIVDVRMPGMTGLELQRRLASSGSRIPIIFITAHGDEAAREQALRAGAAAFLRKPFSDQALLNALEAAL